MPHKNIFPKMVPINNSPRTAGCVSFSIIPPILAANNANAIHKKDNA